MTAWAYQTANIILRTAFSVGLDLHLEGLDKIPAAGGVIVAINHTSFVDPLLVGAYAVRPIVMMSKQENFEIPIMGGIVRLYGAFPIRRGMADRDSIKFALRVLQEGNVLLMSPEGTRSRDGTLQAGHDGVSLLAAKTGVPVLPIAIAGGQRVSVNLKRLRRTRVTVRVGDALYFADAENLAGRQRHAAFTECVMRSLAALLPPEQRGRYGESDVSRA